MEDINIVLVGDFGVGKTTFINTFVELYKSKLEAENVNELKGIQLQITQNQKLFNIKLTELLDEEEYYSYRVMWNVLQQANFFVICYSKDKLYSFQNISEKWMPMVYHFLGSANINKYIIMQLKTDLDSIYYKINTKEEVFTSSLYKYNIMYVIHTIIKKVEECNKLNNKQNKRCI
ncbi:Rab-like_protein [Hexamita inflata]|uniref:Rab-like protein n=1 Tax=Hexamita inflata TaxID=28002 RepID=A0AA86S5J1_9EUKA|nr:Rab-like protein [Hexamita inflata]